MSERLEKEHNGTRVYGASDDLIEIEVLDNRRVGDEISAYDTPKTLSFSDGTILSIDYGEQGIWRIQIVNVGQLFSHVDACMADGEGDDYTDIAYFKPGIVGFLVMDDQNLPPVGSTSFFTKPTEVTAFQWHAGLTMDMLPNWADKSLDMSSERARWDIREDGTLIIHTPRGAIMTARHGDWVTCDVHKELEVVYPSDFIRKYQTEKGE